MNDTLPIPELWKIMYPTVRIPTVATVKKPKKQTMRAGVALPTTQIQKRAELMRVLNKATPLGKAALELNPQLAKQLRGTIIKILLKEPKGISIAEIWGQTDTTLARVGAALAALRRLGYVSND